MASNSSPTPQVPSQPAEVLDEQPMSALRGAYLEDHNVYANLNDIVATLLEVQPEDPLLYLSEQLSMWSARGRASGNDATEAVIASQDDAAARVPDHASPQTTAVREDAPQVQHMPLAATLSQSSIDEDVPATRRYTATYASEHASANEGTVTTSLEDELDSDVVAPMEQHVHAPVETPTVAPNEATVEVPAFEMCVDGASTSSDTDGDDAAASSANGVSQVRYFQEGNPLKDFHLEFMTLQEVLRVGLSAPTQNNAPTTNVDPDAGQDHAAAHQMSSFLSNSGESAPLSFAPMFLSSKTSSKDSARSLTPDVEQMMQKGSACDLLLLACLSPLRVSPPPPNSDDVPPAVRDVKKPHLSIRDICFSAAMRVIGGLDAQEAPPSILYALDMGAALQLTHMVLSVVAFPRETWERHIASTLAVMVGRDARVFELTMVRKLKFALIGCLTDAVVHRPAAEGGAWLPEGAAAGQMEEVIRDAITRIAEAILTESLALASEDSALAKLLPAGPTDTWLSRVDDDFTASRLSVSLAHRLAHLSIVDVTHVVHDVILSSCQDAPPGAFESMLSTLLRLGQVDAHHVAALACIAWHCADAAACGTLSVRAEEQESTLRRASVFVASFTARVKNAIEERWMAAIEAGAITFKLECAEAARSLAFVDVGAIHAALPRTHRDALNTAVEALVGVAQGSVTVNRLFFSLAAAGIFTVHFPKFVYVLISTTYSLGASTSAPIVCLWLCGVGQNIRSGLRPVFHVKQVVEDDGQIDQEQALLDVTLTQSVTALLQERPPNGIHHDGSGFYDLITPTNRAAFDPEDRHALLRPQVWDYLGLGANIDRPVIWRDFLMTKVYHAAKTNIPLDSLMSIAAHMLRRASHLEQKLHAKQPDPSKGTERLPLVLRVLTCVSDTMASMTAACMQADQPSTQCAELAVQWGKIGAATVAQILRTALAPLGQPASLLNDIVPRLVASLDKAICSGQGSSEQRLVVMWAHTELDAYLVGLACAGVWAPLLPSFHATVANECSRAAHQDDPSTLRTFFGRLTSAIVERVDTILVFLAQSTRGTRYLEQWQAAVASNDASLRSAMTDALSTMARSDGVPHDPKAVAAAYAYNAQSVQLATQWAAPLNDVLRGSVDHLAAPALHDAQLGLTFHNHFSMATVMLNHMRRTATGPAAPLEFLIHPRFAAGVVAVLGRTVEVLTVIALPPTSGIHALLHHIKKGGLASLSASVSISLNQVSPRPSEEPSELSTGAVGRSSVGESLLLVPDKLPLRSTDAMETNAMWCSDTAYFIMQSVPRSAQCLRGWYVAQTANALLLLGEGLLFDDVFRLTAPEFQQNLQAACYRLMVHGASSQYFEALINALGKSTVRSQHTEAAIELLHRVGETMEYPSEADRAAVHAVLLPDLQQPTQAMAQFRECVARRGMLYALPVLPLAAFLAHRLPLQRPNGRNFHQVLHDACDVVFRGLLCLVQGIMDLESTGSTQDTAALCIDCITVLTCGGQQHGFALVSCFGELVASLYIQPLDHVLLGRWGRVMLKLEGFLENCVLRNLSLPPSSVLSQLSALGSIMDEGVFARHVEAVDAALSCTSLDAAARGGGSKRAITTTCFSSGSMSRYAVHLARTVVSLVASGSGEVDDEDLARMLECLEGTPASDILWAGLHIVGASSVGEGSGVLTHDVKRAVLSIVHQLVLGLDNNDRRVLAEAHGKKQDITASVQQLEALLDNTIAAAAGGGGQSGSADMQEAAASEAVFAHIDFFLEKHTKTILQEVLKLVVSLMSNWRTTTGSLRKSGHRRSMVLAMDSVNSEDGEELAELDVLSLWTLPPFYYRTDLAPTGSVEALAMAGATPRDLTTLDRWCRTVLLREGVTTVGGTGPLLVKRKSMAKLSASTTVSQTTVVPATTNSDGTRSQMEAYELLRLVLRTVGNALRDLVLESSVPLDTTEHLLLVKQLAQTAPLIYLNVQKNDSQAKAQFAADWQLPYLIPALAESTHVDELTLFKFKESRERTVPPSVLHSVFLDALHPAAGTFARAALSTLRFAATSALDTRRMPHDLILTVVRSLATQRAVSVRDGVFFAEGRIATLLATWQKHIGGDDTGIRFAAEVVTQYTGMVAANAHTAVTALTKTLAKFVSIAPKPSFMAALLAFAIEVTADEENLVLQLFGAQWGPFVHAIAIALAGAGTSVEDLKDFIRLFQAMRLLARVMRAVKRSQILDVQLTQLPYTAMLAVCERVMAQHDSTPQLQPKRSITVSRSNHHTQSTALVQELLRAVVALVTAASTQQGPHAAAPAVSGTRKAPLREWIEASVLNTFTSQQIASVAPLTSERLHDAALGAGSDQHAAAEAVRWALLVALLATRTEELVQQKLQLPPTGALSLRATTRVAVGVHPRMKSPPIDATLRGICLKAMIKAVPLRSDLTLSVRRDQSRARSRIANVIMDYTVDVLEHFHANIVDAFRAQELMLQRALQLPTTNRDKQQQQQPSVSVGVQFDDVQAQCVALMQTLADHEKRSPTFADANAMQVAFAALCRGMHSLFLAPSARTNAATTKRLASAGSGDDNGTSAADVVEFPAAELALFAYCWVRLMPDILQVFNVTLMKYRRIVLERNKTSSTGPAVVPSPEPLQAALLLMHRVACELNDDTKPGIAVSPNRIAEVVADWAHHAMLAKAHSPPSTRAHYGTITQALLEAMDQCDSTIAVVREVYTGSRPMKPAWQRALWYIFDEALRAVSPVSPVVSVENPALNFPNGKAAAAPSPSHAATLPPPSPLPLQGGQATSPQQVPPTTRSPPPAAASSVVPPSIARSTPTVTTPLPPTESRSVAAAPRPAAPVVPQQQKQQQASQPTTYTAAEVAKHANRKDCWVVVDRKVYDITRLLMTHPGGMSVLLAQAGKDGTLSFEENHDAGSVARTKINSFFVGNLSA